MRILFDEPEAPLSLAEAATMLGLSVRTIKNQVRRGRLKARKVGRDWATCRAWVEEYQRDHKGQGRRTDLEHATQHGSDAVRCSAIRTPQVPDVHSVVRLQVDRHPEQYRSSADAPN